MQNTNCHIQHINYTFSDTLLKQNSYLNLSIQPVHHLITDVQRNEKKATLFVEHIHQCQVIMSYHERIPIVVTTRPII